MIRHETIDRAEQVFARGGVEKHLPENGMEGGCKPSSGTGFECVRPENNRMTLIKMSFQAGQITLAIEAHVRRISRYKAIVKF
jgi:hypothetical protein